MKVKVISRDEEQYTKSRQSDVRKQFRNIDPSIHPLEKPREYVRALNATKIDKIFAKPFVGAMEGHMDAIFCMERHPVRTNMLFSGGCDGEIRIWDLSTRKTTWRTAAHTGFVRGITIDSSGTYFLSCGVDRFIKHWKLVTDDYAPPKKSTTPHFSFQAKTGLTDIHHQPLNKHFAAAGANVVYIYDYERREPTSQYSWGDDTVRKLRYNPTESHLIAAAAADRGTMLIDTRSHTPLEKIIMTRGTNSISWNPREPYMLSTASDDCNCYTFDIRKFELPLQIHRDHSGAVLDIDYSPTGKEFVTGSVDCTIRIFSVDVLETNNSREIYHTQRMQRIGAVKYSGDAKFVISGSSDTNIRIWKTQASKPLRPLPKPAQEKVDYSEKLKEKYAEFPAVKSIHRHRQLPANIFRAKSIARIKHMSEETKKERALKFMKDEQKEETKKDIRKKSNPVYTKMK